MKFRLRNFAKVAAVAKIGDEKAVQLNSCLLGIVSLMLNSQVLHLSARWMQASSRLSYSYEM